MARFGKVRRHAHRDGALVIEGGAATAVGGRPDNQDRFAVGSAWGVVSDGAGGQAGGALAAEITTSTLAAQLGDLDREPDARVIQELIARTNDAVNDAREADPAVASMAATVTTAVALSVAVEQSLWLVANVGDSPAWLVSATGAGVRRLTHEHNLAAELVRAGVLSPDEARTHPGRHRITRAMGVGDTVLADITALTIAPGDRLVLASDGVEVLDHDELQAVLCPVRPATETAEALVQAAVARGAPDNVTAVVLRHLPSGSDAPRSR